MTVGDETTHSVASVDVAAMKSAVPPAPCPAGSRVVQGASTTPSRPRATQVGDVPMPSSMKTLGYRRRLGQES